MQFPYNPLTMRMLSSTPPSSMACPSPSMQSQQQTQSGTPGPVAPTRVWEREPPLLSEQYETLSDSDDWGRLPAILIWRTPQVSTSHSSYHCPSLSVLMNTTHCHSSELYWEGGRPLGATFVPTGGREGVSQRAAGFQAWTCRSLDLWPVWEWELQKIPNRLRCGKKGWRICKETYLLKISFCKEMFFFCFFVFEKERNQCM